MLKRSPLRATQPAKAELPILTLRKCANCSAKFRPFSSLVKWCSPVCGAVLGLKKLDKAKAKAAADDRRKTRAQLEALKGIPELKREAQTAFNAWVRRRDMGRNCISCNAPPPDMSGLHAGRDAGHYRSTGAADHLRFHEDNCHAQCVKCNQFKAGNVVEYRAGLVWRIGPERLEALESNSTPIKWTREGLRAIRDDYRKRAKEQDK